MNIFKAQAEFLKAADIKTWPELIDRYDKLSVHEQRELDQFGGVTFKDLQDVLVDNSEMSTRLITEEYKELMAETQYYMNGNVNDLKECIDLMYVCAQYMNVCVGPDKAQKLFNAVHNNNMSKCTDGKLVKREDGKVLKPEGFDKMGWLKEYES